MIRSDCARKLAKRRACALLSLAVARDVRRVIAHWCGVSSCTACGTVPDFRDFHLHLLLLQLFLCFIACVLPLCQVRSGLIQRAAKPLSQQFRDGTRHAGHAAYSLFAVEVELVEDVLECLQLCRYSQTSFCLVLPRRRDQRRRRRLPPREDPRLPRSTPSPPLYVCSLGDVERELRKLQLEPVLPLEQRRRGHAAVRPRCTLTVTANQTHRRATCPRSRV
jgi:hypothetical protein